MSAGAGSGARGPALPAPGTALAASFAVSLALHVGLIAYAQPGTWGKRVSEHDSLSVRIERPAAVPPAPRADTAVRPDRVRVAPRAATAKRRASAPDGPVPSPPPEAIPAPDLPLQPLRLRVVADPEEYGPAERDAARPYAWGVESLEIPLPREGIAVAYPEQALRKGEKGLVVVRLDLGAFGEVERMQFLCSSPAFESAVSDALGRAEFPPPLARNGTIPVWMLLEFAFLAEPGGRADADRAERSLLDLQRRCLDEQVARGGA